MLRPALRQLRTARVAGLGVRVVVLVLGAIAYALAAPGALFGLLAVLAVIAAVAVPEHAGPGPAVASLALGWAVQVGLSDPPVVRTVALAAVLSLLVSAGALAAVVPLGGGVETAVVRRWALRSVWPVAVAVALGSLLAIPGRLPGSPLLDLAGLVGGLGLLVLGVRLIRQPSNDGRSPSHTES